MRWRGMALDLSLAASGIGLDLLVTWGTGGEPPTAAGDIPVWVLAILPLAVGLPMGLVRRWPGQVCLFLAAALVVCDRLGVPTADTAQILLPISLGVLARTRGLRWTVPVAVLACAATTVNLADPGLTFSKALLFYPVLIVAFPLIVGRYLRVPVTLPEGEDLGPALDLLLAGGGVAFAVLGTWPVWDEGVVPVWAVGLMVVMAGLALGVVRRLPGTVLLLESVLVMLSDRWAGAAGNTLQVLVCVALGVFAMRATWSWVAAGYLLTLTATAITVVDGGTEITFLRTVALMAMVASPIAIGRYVRARQVAARQSEELAAERTRADRLSERERIAREVHDVVAHHVGAMVLRAAAAEYAGAKGPAAEALSDIRETGHQVLEDLRGLINVLRDPDRDDLYIGDPGDVMGDAVSRMTGAGLRVDLDLAPGHALAPLVVRAAAARIVQEGLTNVLKHAGPGAEVRIRVGMEGGALTVEVRNGPGAAAGTVEGRTGPQTLPSSGQGIEGMRERARAFGGRLTAGPLRDGGWRLAAALPVLGEAGMGESDDSCGGRRRPGPGAGGGPDDAGGDRRHGGVRGGVGWGGGRVSRGSPSA